VATCDPGETRMKFRGYVRVYNRSGEEYENAEIRLIVGTINLVEKIAELARRYGIAMPKPTPKPPAGPPRPTDPMVKLALRESFGKARKAKNGGAPKQVVKEGLSEYFMFSVEGSETIANGWSKRMQAVKADDVTFDIVYRMRTYQYGPRPVRFFVWRNDDEHKLGDGPLPNGRVRVFRDNGSDGLSYLGEKILRYVPIKAEIEVNLGPDDLVVYETRRTRVERFNFQFDRRSRVTGWDEKQQWIHTIRNYRTKPIAFELRLLIGGDVEYTSEVETTLFDYRTTETKLPVAARGKREYPCTVLIHHGSNAKQNRIRLKDPTR
jgi:hypothetical protein